MKPDFLWKVIFCTIWLMLPIVCTYAEYIEGIDTTDENGYGMDSAFQVTPEGKILSQSCVLYGLIHGETGPLNYSFDDIKYAALSGYSALVRNVPESEFTAFTCFVVKKKDSTYSKIQVVKRLQDTRLVFKFGSNTIPFNRMLEKPDYDRSVKYKPNNVTHHFYYGGAGIPFDIPPDSLFWEPPLPNNNHLRGYVLYQSRQKGINTDTTVPINASKWDSIAFTDTCLLIDKLKSGYYINIAAIYEEGKSDFIKGWTFYAPTAVGIKRKSVGFVMGREGLTIDKTNGGFSISATSSIKNAILSIYNVSGRQIACFPLAGSYIFWNAPQQFTPTGLYLLRAEFPDQSVITQPFTITR